MTSETFIRRYYLPDTHICKDIIDWFESNTELHHDGRVYFANNTMGVDKDFKDSTCISVKDLSFAYSQEPLAKFLDWLWGCVNQYITDFPELDGMAFAMSEGFNIQRYLPPDQGFKAFHQERQSVETSNRLMVFMLYLNTVNDLGGTEYKYYNHVEKAEEGKLLIWPPDFTHTHRGVVSPTEKKYVLTGWYSLISS